MSTPLDLAKLRRKQRSQDEDEVINPHRERVAAPLEPTREKIIEEIQQERDLACTKEGQFLTQVMREMYPDGVTEECPACHHAKAVVIMRVAQEGMRRYAAAVSKNLTDKYAELEAKWMRELLTVSNEIGEARDRIAELEKEIAALRASFQKEIEGKLAKIRAKYGIGEIAALRKP